MIRNAAATSSTIVFESDDPQAVVSGAMVALAKHSGLERAGFWMPLADVADIVDAHAAEPDAARREVTLHAGGTIDVDDPEVVRVAVHRRCEIVDAGDGWFVSINQRERESNATPVAERLTGLPATSRSLTTLVRLIDRFGTPA